MNRIGCVSSRSACAKQTTKRLRYGSRGEVPKYHGTLAALAWIIFTFENVQKKIKKILKKIPKKKHTHTFFVKENEEYIFWNIRGYFIFKMNIPKSINSLFNRHVLKPPRVLGYYDSIQVGRAGSDEIFNPKKKKKTKNKKGWPKTSSLRTIATLKM